MPDQTTRLENLKMLHPSGKSGDWLADSWRTLLGCCQEPCQFLRLPAQLSPNNSRHSQLQIQPPKLAAQLQWRKMEKTYLGLVYGHPWPSQGKIDAPIGRHPYHRTKMAVRPEGKGREALTLYRVVEKFEDAALVEFELKTGRTHQIRVHMAHIGHPIVGDQVYGTGYKTKVKNPELRKQIEQLGRHFLHAAKLRFKHPRTGQFMEFTSNLPGELKQVLDAFRFQDSATKAPRHEGNLPR